MAKRCIKCGETKPLIEFSRKKTAKDGLMPYCRQCNRARTRQWAVENPERYNAGQARWKARNLVATRARSRAWNAAHRDRIAETSRAWHRADSVGHDTVALAYAEILQSDPCSYCGAIADTLDHIEPVSQGGALDQWDNLTAACRSCNSGKWTHPMLLWMARCPM